MNDPLVHQLDRNAVRFAELLLENQALRNQVRDLEAENEALHDHIATLEGATVHVLPGMGHLAEAVGHLSDAKDGDVLRVAGTGFEMHRILGVWQVVKKE